MTQEGLRATPGGHGSDRSRQTSRLVRVVAGSSGTCPGSGSVLKAEPRHCSQRPERTPGSLWAPGAGKSRLPLTAPRGQAGGARPGATLGMHS